MLFVVSDTDMENRYEQTMLTLSTLSPFGYQNYDHIVMRGNHFEYCHKLARVEKAGLEKRFMILLINTINRRRKYLKTTKSTYR